MKNDIIKQFWFEKIESENFENCDSEEAKMLEYINLFQRGRFETKKEFVDFFINSDCHDIFVIGMRLFMAIASHSDFQLLETFLSDSEEEQVEVFLAYVQDSGSIQTIPYLLALYEDWDETNIGDTIARKILEILGEEYRQEEQYCLEELGNKFISFSREHDLSKYYYWGKELFLGDITKDLIMTAMQCRTSGKKMYTNCEASILSNSVGIKCPVSRDMEITDERIAEIYKYVKVISELPLKKGCKYFYNHLIG